ncbi:Dynactin p62 family protein [Colletotrichum higginsianum IMI 349063]|uniref:Dynactin subunit 4 n=1 Tax=Colletotrichum higginsianum (strain IMI 349063) TaxID=759273 RepID=A0A1B7YR68_COLHI|nr:Dynactin p62 family protein [Colletotrichum higginsianum IMI 349063]OBR14444.1 Dynactin p62 family protein [Colletotrichum higginsianum IMI 349063]
MAPLTPYTYIRCPCSETREHEDGSSTPGSPEDDERTFDPRAPRANFSLFPLEHLMYCEDCHQIRCPRCVNEEIVTYYCPNCLFEVPSSNLKSEGNRCTRSCFQCPVCVGPLAVTSLDAPPESSSLLTADGSAPQGGSYVLTCSYCTWSSTEIGIKFDRPNGIHGQLAKLQNGGQPKLTPKEHKERKKEKAEDYHLDPEDMDSDLQFSLLKSFYQNQMANANPSAGGLSSLGDLGLNSPGSLSRIMSLYTGNNFGPKQARGKVQIMREAESPSEGLKTTDLDETEAIEKLRHTHSDDTTTLAQNSQQPDPVRFRDELRPIPYLLRTKRSKRCPICRHIISKPEAKISNTRFRIRLVAGSYIPTITIRPLNSEVQNIPSTARPPIPQELWLTPLKPVQYLLTFKNPIFETVKVSLATPSNTPGRFASTVTVLCPQFEIDANTDMWDDALKDDGEKERRRGEEGGMQQAEVGKIYDRGRNWVSIVLEVVPASLERGNEAAAAAAGGDGDELREDEEVLEIPMFVRIEWETEAQGDGGTTTNRDKEAREKRELAYWCVLGVGRINQT